MIQCQNLDKKIEFIKNSLDVLTNSLEKKAHLEPKVENLNLDSAITFLNQNGYQISKSQIYKLTSKSEIPFHRFGNRLIFKVNELLDWTKSRTISNDRLSQGLIAISKSAKRK